MIKAFGPKRSQGFRDNYLAPVLIGMALLLNSCVTGQSVDTTKILQKNNALGYDNYAGRYRGYLIIPNDTPRLKVADSGAIADYRTKLFLWTGYYWTLSSASAASINTKTPITKIGDSLAIRFDTLTLQTTNNTLESKVLTVDNIAALRALPYLSYSNGKTVEVRGYYSPGDGGGGRFVYSSTGGGSGDDGGYAIIPTGATTQGFTRELYNQYLPSATNIKYFGAVGDGTTNATTALNKCITGVAFQNANYYGFPLDIYLPAGTYLITPGSISSIQTSIRIHGDGQGKTIIKLSGNGAVFQPGSVNKYISFTDLTIDGNGYTNTMIDYSAGVGAGALFENLELLNIKGTGIVVNGDNVVVNNCHFYHNQNFDSVSTSTSIKLNYGKHFRITNNTFDFPDFAINIGGGSLNQTSGSYYAGDGLIEGNTITSWWFLRPIRNSALRGVGNIVHWGHTTPDAIFCRQALIVSGKNFASYSIPHNTTIRVLDTLFHATSNLTIGGNYISSATYNFSTYGFKEADYAVIKDLTNGFSIFATISTDKGDSSKLYFSNPLDLTTRQPVRFPMPNMVAYDVSIMRVKGASFVAEVKGDTIFVGYFASLTGDTTLPASTSTWEILQNHGSHGIMLNPSTAHITVNANHLIGGWADQYNTYGSFHTVTNNEAGYGEDVGYTNEGKANKFIGNRAFKQGSTGFYSGQQASNCIFMGNSATDVQMVNVGADALLSGMAIGGNSNIISENIVQVKENVNMNYGITIFSGDSNIIQHNQSHATQYDIRLQDFQGNAAERNIVEGNFGYTYCINSLNNYISGSQHNLTMLPPSDSIYAGKIFLLPNGTNTDAYLEIKISGAYSWDKLANQAAVDQSILSAKPQFDALFINDGSTTTPYSLDTVSKVGTRYAEYLLSKRTDSVVANWPSGPGGGTGRTVITHKSTVGDSLFIKINDSLYRPLKIIMGTNMSATKTDSTYTINGAGGSAEINTKDTTLIASGTVPILAATIQEYILVKPVSDLLAFQEGSATNASAYISATPCAGGKWTVIPASAYFDINDTLYFSGITSSTEIKIVKKLLHE